MAKIMWTGEDHLHPDGYGPKENKWNGIAFPKGEAVEVSDPKMIAKAKGNSFYVVEEDEAPRKPSRPKLSLPDPVNPEA